jgi:hypothetical protein
MVMHAEALTGYVDFYSFAEGRETYGNGSIDPQCKGLDHWTARIACLAVQTQEELSRFLLCESTRARTG